MTEELRDKLAKALRRWDVGGDYPLDLYREMVDVLLPIVAAYVEQQARERAAVELEAAHRYADAILAANLALGCGDTLARVLGELVDDLDRRAAALRGQA